jgi:aspartate/glutamate racemase
MQTLAFIHTIPGHAERFRELAASALSGWSSYAVVDESLLLDAIARGGVSPKTVQRLTGYVFAAADAGASAAVVTCSTLGATVDAIRPISPIPLFRIDRGMAEAAVRQASRIGVLATLPTTLEPTASLLRQAAREAGAACEISQMLCEGAFDKLRAGDRQAHNAAVRAGFSQLAAGVDLVVLAQASMADAVSGGGLEAPFLTSPELGMAAIARNLMTV